MKHQQGNHPELECTAVSGMRLILVVLQVSAVDHTCYANTRIHSYFTSEMLGPRNSSISVCLIILRAMIIMLLPPSYSE
jgi:hypothetical protein